MIFHTSDFANWTERSFLFGEPALVFLDLLLDAPALAVRSVRASTDVFPRHLAPESFAELGCPCVDEWEPLAVRVVIASCKFCGVVESSPVFVHLGEQCVDASVHSSSPALPASSDTNVVLFSGKFLTGNGQEFLLSFVVKKVEDWNVPEPVLASLQGRVLR
jgi:hypothetical protein